MNDRPLGEFDLIARIKAATTRDPGVELGIGDDCAILSPNSNRLLVTTDLLMDGRHFILDECGPEAAGAKAMAVNLSDIAAMAGRPIAAFVAVALPIRSAEPIALGLMKGLRSVGDRFGVALAGGDTNAWNGPLVICVTIIGQAIEPGPVRRSGAKTGDVIFVTGPLGGSILGRHLRPSPRIDEALLLHSLVGLHAMIDLSDGLASDLGHILEASGGLGATLDAEAIPIHDDARQLAARDGRPPLEHALVDGEDFELCFTVDPDDAFRLVDSPPPGIQLTRIGRVEDEPGIRLREPDGHVRPLQVRGFDHLRPLGGPADDQ